MKKRKKQVRKKQKIGKKETLGIILVLLTAIVSGFSIVANKFFIVSIDPFVFTGLRAVFI
jgi:uncharacterized membrane-anchored protein